MPAPEIIHQLVARFAENREAYRSGKYNEAQLRQEFLDPFFEALGWDIYNRNGFSPEYRDVVIEDSLQIEGASKAPDYAFKIGKERKFYVEAKKPSVDIKGDIHPAYQLRRYAWNARLPLSILTDFEELAVYNCKNKPNPGDSAATGRDKFFRYTDYVEKWDEIAGIFSRDAVWKGSFDRFAESSKGKKGTTEVDDAILGDIESWRKLLALNIALRNPQVADERQLNYAVQMTIDRILFLRICEDRGIEPEEQFKNMTSRPGIYARMVELFRRADMKYNSGLFHFSEEKGNDSAADTFTPGLSIDDKVLKEIIASIYYPCPYIFKEIPVEILGQVYEQFLGKVIRLTPGHTAKIDLKPEVRKAGGVYYTPKYIVEYIVANTVGRLLEGKTPAEAAELKIVDPACGSGSFLLGAYQHLLDWHVKWYTEHDPEKWAKGRSPALMAANGGGWKLTTARMKEILVNNIHGVDIDAQAVEVTKLSLLLKVLEEESGQLSLGIERVLPDLGRNIQCGNSLIGEDYFEGQLVVDEKERQRVNPFEWETSFPSVFKKGGFDAVIGNPPYGAEISKRNLEYIIQTYPKTKKFPDSYCFFTIKASQIIKIQGLLGFIVPNTFCDLENCDDFREWFLSENKLLAINQTGWAFKDAIVDTIVFILERTISKEDYSIIISNGEKHYYKFIHEFINHPRKKIDYRNDSVNVALLAKMEQYPCLSDFVTSKAGVKLYEKGKGTPPQSEKTLQNRPFTKKDDQPEGWRPLFRGGDVNRYSICSPKEFVNYGPWLAAPRNFELFDSPKIIMRRTDDKLKSSIEKTNAICVNSCHVIKINKIAQNVFSYEYLVGLLNSTLLQKVFEIQNPQMVGKIFSEIKVIYVDRLPIKPIDFSKPNEVKQHDRMVALVERMLELHKRTAQTPQEQERLARDIASTDREIDKLVYELYGLTAEEIKIVEEKN